MNAHERELARVDTRLSKELRASALIIDIDGCILDWTLPFETWLEQVKGHKRIVGAEQHYAMHNRWEGMQPDQMMMLIDEFNCSPHFANLPPEKDAVEGLKHLKAVYPARQVIAITACGNGPRTAEYRLKNLADLLGLGFFDQVNFLPLGASKQNWFTQFACSIVVEDSLSHAIHASEAGHGVILIDQPYNHSDAVFTGIIRSTWSDVINNMKKEAVAA